MRTGTRKRGGSRALRRRRVAGGESPGRVTIRGAATDPRRSRPGVTARGHEPGSRAGVTALWDSRLSCGAGCRGRQPLKMSQDFKGQVTLVISHGVMDLRELWTQNHENKKKLYRLIYNAIKGDSDNPPVILKVHSTLFGMDLRFDSMASCSAFLERYKNGDMEVQLNRGLTPNHQDSFTTSLQVRGEVLVKQNFDLSTWLRLIGQNEPTALQDDDVKKMQHDLSMLNLNPRDASGGDLVNSNAGPSSSCQLVGIPTHDACLSAPMVIPDNKFIFQEKLYDDRLISMDDHNNFAKKVGNGWKAVARQLMRTCKGLEDPTIENITFEYNTVYEQAFQMLRKFIQSEAKRATLSRLVKALVDERLCNVVEFLLDI